ncbi:MAG: isocitrate lyase/phosphoenolpyruvate mutase family protein [Alphaproteobacteria bacterium]
MDKIAQKAKAEAFLTLHHAPEILVLPNCWDAGSALILAEAGFPAIATTSAGIAFSRGFADGHRISRAEMAAEVKRCADAVSIPVSADMEGGYGQTPDDVAETVRQAIAAGAIGANIEDGVYDVGTAKPHLLDPALCVDRIRAGREVADALDIPFVINARVDVYLIAGGERTGAMFEDAVARCNACYAAGARSVYIPGIADADLIGRLAQAVEGPLNILAGATTPPTARLQELGVARVSIGGSLARACLKLVQHAAAELRDGGTFGYAKDSFSNAELNRRFEP